MWYAFTLDYFVAEAKTKKELIDKLPIGALPYKVKRYGAGRYEILEQDESEKSFWIKTYYIYDSLFKADNEGFKTLYDYYLLESKGEQE